MAKTKSDSSAGQPKTVWQGALSFGLITFPVRACTGARAEKISFNQICPIHRCKINMPTICKGGPGGITHDVVKGELLKGFEHRKGEFVYFNKDEIEATAPETSKSMEILQFIKADELDAIYLDSSFVLLPGEGAGDPFRLLRLSMEAGNWVALARITMHGNEHVAAIRPYRDGFTMHTLYWANEVREFQVEQPATAANPALVAVCGQLINALAAPFQPEKFTNQRATALQAMIDAKIADPNATAPTVAAPARKPPVADMMAALQASLAAAAMQKGGNGAATAAA